MKVETSFLARRLNNTCPYCSQPEHLDNCEISTGEIKNSPDNDSSLRKYLDAVSIK